MWYKFFGDQQKSHQSQQQTVQSTTTACVKPTTTIQLCGTQLPLYKLTVVANNDHFVINSQPWVLERKSVVVAVAISEQFFSIAN